MIKRKMAKTRIHLVGGKSLDVRGRYEIVQSILDNTSARWVHFDLADGIPVSFQIRKIAYITKA